MAKARAWGGGGKRGRREAELRRRRASAGGGMERAPSSFSLSTFGGGGLELSRPREGEKGVRGSGPRGGETRARRPRGRKSGERSP